MQSQQMQQPPRPQPFCMTDDDLEFSNLFNREGIEDLIQNPKIEQDDQTTKFYSHMDKFYLPNKRTRRSTSDVDKASF